MFNELVNNQDIITKLEGVEQYVYVGHLIHKLGSLLPKLNQARLDYIQA